MINSESNRIAEVVSQGRSMTWGKSLQCQIVRVGMSQCPTGGWRNHQGTVKITENCAASEQMAAKIIAENRFTFFK